MTLNAQFVIDQNSKITITVPSLPEKDNEIFIPTETLHQLDIGKALYEDKERSILLLQDVIKEIVYPYYLILERALTQAFTLPDKVDIGNVGYYINMYREYRTHDLEVLKRFKIWWSKQDIQTLLYSVNNKFYLEIVPIYPWHLEAPKTDDEYESFDKFIQRYTPYIVTEVPRKNIITWRNRCYHLLHTLIGEELMPNREMIFKNSNHKKQ